MANAMDIVSVSDHPLVGALVGEVVREVAPNALFKSFESLEAFQASAIRARVLIAGASEQSVSVLEDVLKLVDDARVGLSLVHSVSKYANVKAGIEDKGIVWLPKEASVKEFYAASIDLLRRAEIIASPGSSSNAPKNQFQSNISTEGSSKPLTLRQVEVLELLSTGLSAKEVAKRLSISPETVRGHVKDVFVRLGVKNIAQAIEVYSKARRISSMLQDD